MCELISDVAMHIQISGHGMLHIECIIDGGHVYLSIYSIVMHMVLYTQVLAGNYNNII